MLRWAGMFVALNLLIACGGSPPSDPGAAATPCVTPTPVDDLSDLPKDFPFEEWGTVTYLRSKKGFEVVRFVAETTVVELHPEISRSLNDAGYQIVGADNEGFESEIFFTPGRARTGYFQLREGPCKGQVTTSMIFKSAE